MNIPECSFQIGEKTLILRSARTQDAEMLLEYLKVTSGETPYLVREPEEITMTVEEEKTFIQGQLDLEVSTQNSRAIALYQKLGFKIYGIFPRDMKHKDGTYSDSYWMQKIL